MKRWMLGASFAALALVAAVYTASCGKKDSNAPGTPSTFFPSSFHYSQPAGVR